MKNDDDFRWSHSLNIILISSQVYCRPPEGAVGGELGGGGAEDEEHEGLGGDALQVVVQGDLALGVALRLEVEEGADHAEQDDGRRLRRNEWLDV